MYNRVCYAYRFKGFSKKTLERKKKFFKDKSEDSISICFNCNT